MAFNKNKFNEIVQKHEEVNQPEEPAQSPTSSWRDTFTSIMDQDTNDAQWGAGVMNRVGTLIGDTVQDIGDAFSSAGEKWRETLHQGANLQEAYLPENVAQANATGDYSQQQIAVSNVQTAATDFQTSLGEAALSPFRESAREFMAAYEDDEDSAFQNMAQDLRRTDASLNYFMTDEEKLERARKIEAETGISADTFLSDNDAFKSAMQVYDYTRKMKAVGQDIDKVWEEFPELKDIAKMSKEDAAIALHNMESIRSTHGIVETFQKMFQLGNKRLEYDNLQYKIMTGEADDNDRQRAEDLKKQIEEDSRKHAPSIFDDPAAAIAGALAGSTPEMLQGVQEGARDAVIAGAATAAIGAIAGGAGGAGVGAVPGAAGGFVLGAGRSILARLAGREIIMKAAGYGMREGMFRGMAKAEIGDRYGEYTEMKGTDGKPLMTDDQARAYAMLGGSLNAGIEMANFGLVTKALRGAPHANAVFGSILEETGAKLAAEERMAGFARSRMADMFKITASEAGEEGLQSISDDLIRNKINMDAGDRRTEKLYSSSDILARAAVSTIESLPGALGFGIMGAGSGTVSGGIRTYRTMRHKAQFDVAYGENARKTMTGTLMLERLQQTIGENKMKEKAPDVQRKILRSQLQNTDFKTAYIDTEMALKKQNGMDDLKAVATGIGMTNEELQTAIDTKGHILVPTEQFAQVKSSPDLLESVSFSPEADSIARMKESANSAREEMEKRQNAAVERQLKLMDNVISEYFPEDAEGRVDGEGREMAQAAIFTNTANPAQGWNMLRKDIQAQYDAYLAPALATLRDGMGHAGMIEVENERGQKEYRRITENAPWYRAFYKEHKRKPTEAELREMAVGMMTGTNDIEGFSAMIHTEEDAAEAEKHFQEAKKTIEGYQHQLEVLDRIKDRMRSLNGVEIELTEGLSKEGFQVYRAISQQLQGVGGRTARAARMDAILFARHADIYAEIVRKNTGRDYTAADYMCERYDLDTTGNVSDIDTMNQINADVDLDAQVPVLDIGALLPTSNLNHKEVKALIEELVEADKKITTADNKAVVSILEKDISHITFSSRKLLPYLRKRRTAALRSVNDLLENAVLIESIPNRKKKKKRKVRAYHRFYVPVKMGNRVEVLRLVAEEQEGEITLNPTDVNLYDVILENKKSATPQSGVFQPVGGDSSALDTISIRDMLKGVKDYDGEFYIGGPLYQMAGSNAKTANLAALDRAKELWKQDENADKIYQETGWLRGADGKWRFEIPDNAEKINVDSLTGAYDVNLGEVYDNEKLYQAYPWLELTWVTVKELDESIGGYADYVGEQIVINKKLLAEKPDAIPYVLIHEIQHLIQHEEKFAIGGNSETVRRQIQEEIDHIDEEIGPRGGDAQHYISTLRRQNEAEFNSFYAETEEEREDAEKEYEKCSEITERYGKQFSDEEKERLEELDSRREYLRGVLEDKLKRDSDLYSDLAGEQEARYAADRASGKKSLSEISNEAVKNRIKEKWNIDNGKAPTPHNINAIVVFGDQEYYAHDNVSESDTLYQKAYHGTPHQFDKFDLDMVGSGQGRQIHGWGLYFTKNKKVAAGYKKRLSNLAESKGTTLEVDIPEDNEMLSEYDIEQSEYVQNAINKVVNSLTTEQIDSIRRSFFLSRLGTSFSNRKQQAYNDKEKLVESFSKLHSEKKLLKNIARKALLKNGYSTEQISEFERDENLSKKEAVKHQSDLAALKSAAEDETRFNDNMLQEQASDERIREYMKKERGATLYADLSKILGGKKEASLYLNQFGIKGISYDGGEEGRCFVVFDDKAIDIIRQINAQEARGMITRMSNGQRIISLLESADESTFMHEMSHMFLMDLEDLAGIDDVSKKELDLVNEWANWQKGMAAEYKGTPWAKEFAAYEDQIVDAEEHGDFDTAESVKARWRQERFARAFELYLRDGHAPAKGLKAVFRKFKQFLRAIYTAFTGEGGKANASVRRVMDRMIATEAEIDEMALDDRYKDIEKAGGEQLFTEDEAETYRRWQQEATDEAKEKLMKIVMKDLEGKRAEEYTRRIEEERERYRTYLENSDVYLAEQAIIASGGDESIVLNWYESKEAFLEEWESVSDIDTALEEYMKAYEEQLDHELMNSYLSEEAVNKAMDSTSAQEKLESLKAKAFAKKLATMNRITTKTKQAEQSILDKLTAIPEDFELQVDKTDTRVKALMKAINELRFSTRWNPSDYARIEDMIRANTKEEVEEALKDIKKSIREDAANEQAVIEANEGRMKAMREMARKAIAEKPLSEATDVYRYRKEQKKMAKRVQAMIKAKRWDMAMRAQESQAMQAAMLQEAEKMKEWADKKLATVKKQLNARTVRLPKNERYWHRHLAYILRIIPKDAVKPDSGVDELQTIFNRLTESYDMEATDAPMEIFDIAANGEDFRGWKSLTKEQFEEAIDAMTILYTTGRDAFKMKTIGGKDIQDVVDEITNSAAEGVGRRLRVHTPKIEENKGGIGYNDTLGKYIPALSEKGQDYLTASLKPEVLLELYSQKAFDYIYGLYEKAGNAEAERVAKEYDALKEILSSYSHKERMAWKKEKYELQLPTGKEMVTKENILCMALNLGNETNQQRLLSGLGYTGDYRENLGKLMPFLEEHMTEKDWKLVQDVWDHLQTYWKETVEVEEKLNGVALQAVKRQAFTVTLPDGQEMKLAGGYYPIAYNSKKSSRAEEQEINKAAQGGMSGVQIFGMGRGYVKSRTDANIENRPLLLEFRVIPLHIQQVIHNISYRLPARDVYRLITNREFEQGMKETMGNECYRIIKSWAEDVWKITPGSTNSADQFFERSAQWLRGNSVMAIMGYRLWPALENISNIGPLMDKLGAAHAIGAVNTFYTNRKENMQLLYKSIFMKNRINSMDRDITQQDGLFKADYTPFEFIRRHAYDMMLYSDLMLSAPLWVQTYKDCYTDKLVEVRREQEAKAQAIIDAQAEVDKIKAERFDSENRIHAIQNHLLERRNATPEELAMLKQSSPFAIHSVPELQAEVGEHQRRLKETDRTLWEAEVALQKTTEAEILTDAEMIPEAERRAVAEADKAIRETFGSGKTQDLSSVQRSKSEFVKLMTTFYSFFNTQFNALYKEYAKARFISPETNAVKRYAPFARSVFYRIMVMSLIGYSMKFALGLDGDDDRDKYRKVKGADGKEEKVEIPTMERFLIGLSKNTLSQVTGSFIGVRDAANFAINWLFDGNTYGRSINPFSVGGNVAGEFIKTFELIAKKGQKDLEIAEKEAKREQKEQEQLKKLRGKKRQEYLKKLEEEKKYRKPEKHITYSEIARSAGRTVSDLTAGRTGLTNTVVDSITTTMMYLNDPDGRYDPQWKNILRSVLFDKKPKEREIPDKPKAEPKKKGKEKRKKE